MSERWLFTSSVGCGGSPGILEPTPLQPRREARRDGPTNPIHVYAPPDVPFSLISATAVELPLPPESIVLATADCRFVQSDEQFRELARGRAGLWDGALRSLQLTHGTCAAAMSGPRTLRRALAPERSIVGV